MKNAVRMWLEKMGWWRPDGVGDWESRVTPDYVTMLRPDEVFVFGCRHSGRHWEGAASFALAHFGAVFGQGEGPQGQSYAIPTAGVCLRHIGDAVGRFTQYAARHPEKRFLVTAVGCGLGGWRPSQVAPFFRKAAALKNVWLPQVFWEQLEGE